MKDRKPAIYCLGGLVLKGFVEDAGNGLFWFNMEEREKENRRPLLVDSK